LAELAKALSPGFSVADAEQPRLSFDANMLTVIFREWTEDQIELQFPACYAVRWQAVIKLKPEERGDEVLEITGSKWLADHRNYEAIAPQEPIRHFKLNFNAWGQLEVLAEDIILARRTSARGG